MLKLCKYFIQNFWKRPKDNQEVDYHSTEVVPGLKVQELKPACEIVNDKITLLSKIDLNDVGEPIIMNPNTKKTLLVVNDIPTTLKLLELDFKTIETEYHKDVLGSYKVVICSGRHANLMAYKYLLNNQVDKALLDVILSDSIIRMDNQFIEFNGFDIAEEIKKRNQASEIGIYTSVELTSTLDIMHKYLSAFKRLTRSNVIDKYININLSDRTAQLSAMF
jgi:hypothetical protein